MFIACSWRVLYYGMCHSHITRYPIQAYERVGKVWPISKAPIELMVEPRRVTPWVRLEVEAIVECLSRPNLTHSSTLIFVRASPFVTLQTHTAMLVSRALFVELCHEICCVVWVKLLLVVVWAQALTTNPNDLLFFCHMLQIHHC